MVGSAPVERTKMMGTRGVESWKEEARSKGGTSTKCLPRFWRMNLVTPSTTFSSRSTRISSSFWNCDSVLSHLPGSASSDGVRQSYHAFHADVSISSDSSRPAMPLTFSRFTMPPRCSFLIQSSAGFAGSLSSSMKPPLVRKKPHSSSEIVPCSSRITCEVIMNENIFLSFSNRPRHTFVYTSSVITLIMIPTRSSRSSDLALLSMHELNRLTKNCSEYWYIGSTDPMSATTK
mmetsp:Transcript_34219/g.81575  ORF Transcript_34219/g.81575 Transcript_34219/m.81575 type:complete len:233 (-) Transcript_34219:2681-3379(-)